MAGAERYFLNTLPDYDPGQEKVLAAREQAKAVTGGRLPEGETRDVTGRKDSLLCVTREDFLESGLQLKNEVVTATWKTEIVGDDPFAYVGTLGTAILCLRSFLATKDKKNLETTLNIVRACASAAASMRQYVTFLCGHAGIYSVGAVASHLKGDKDEFWRYMALFYKVSRDPSLVSGSKKENVSNELLYGRAGFLWAALFINSHVGKETVPLTVTGPIVDAIISDGLSQKLPGGGSPLMYSWHGTPYLGAAHGLAGILHTVMQFPLTETDEKHVKDALRFLIEAKFPSGNYPSSLGREKDELVHWCHGAPGVALTLCQAAKTFPDSPQFLREAIEAGELVWTRGLLRRLGLCHGISGNSYVFLALHRVTGGKKHLHRGRMFAGFLRDSWRSLIGRGEMSGGDRPYSLFEGAAGLAHLWIDLGDDKENTFFPGYEVPDVKEKTVSPS